MAKHWVGTSGWSYDAWRGLFYPRAVKKTDWLGRYAQSFKSVELNASFYHLPKQTVLEGWAAKTPPGFVFAVKAWRAITHYRRLADCDDHLRIFYERLDALGPKAGPVLFQLPPRFAADLPRLRDFLKLLPKGRRHAFEFRDPSWHEEAVFALLADHGAAFCIFEMGPLQSPRVATADFVYLRLHGHRRRYKGNYSDAVLRDWAGWLGDRMGEGRNVYAYFDNTDEKDHALRNARTLDAMLANGEGTWRPFSLPAGPLRR